jgi:hypothetical protein
MRAALLSASVVSLLLGLTGFDFGASASWMFIGIAVVLFAALTWVESRAADPILPVGLFRRNRLFSTATSTMQFSRSIGGTIGVSVMGATLSLRLAASVLKFLPPRRQARQDFSDSARQHKIKPSENQ